MSSFIATESGTPSQPLFIAVCGSSGVGKTTLVEALVRGRPDRFRRARSFTTRSKRDGEDATEYDFVSRVDFQILAGTEQLLNADLVHGNWYGISGEDVRTTLAAGLIPVKEMAAKNVVQLQARGLQPLIVHVVSSDPVPLRPGREADQAELGAAPGTEIASVRILRDGQSPSSMSEQLERWLDAALVMGAVGATARTHSADWDEDNRLGYDAIAQEFTDELRVTTAYFHHLSTPFWRWVRDRWLAEGETYLEVAPGRGWLTDILEWTRKHGYRGLELSAVMRSLNPRASQIDLGSAASMPYGREAFTGVFGSLVDPFLNANFLAEAMRVLKPGGWLALTTPAAEWATALRGDTGFYQTTFVRSDGSSTTVGSACISSSQLQSALSLLGFVNIEISEIKIAKDATGLPPAITAAMNRLPPGARELSVVTTCMAEKSS